MRYHDTIIIGAGQAGLALSHELTRRGIDHVLIERGRLGERWRSERWDSLRLLTPNWMTRLPGLDVTTEDPEGFRSKDDLVALLESYARSFHAPVMEETAVTRVAQHGGGFDVHTTAGRLRCANVVVATGHCGRPQIPSFADAIDPSIGQIHASRYRNPDLLPPGGVVVVGAGASGIQIASELREAGRDVVLSTGHHARALRSYRGHDLWWWLDRIGSLDETVDDVSDVEAARRTPSLGLTGAEGGRDIDLGVLQRAGVRLAGRAVSIDSGTNLRFGDNLTADVSRADERLRRLLDRFDAVATSDGFDDLLGPPLRPLPIRIERQTAGIDLSEGYGTVLWATGYDRSYEWLDIGVLDPSGDIIQRRGVTPVAGLYVLGMRFQWTRGSHFLDRVGRDAEYVADHIERAARHPAVA